MGMFDWISYKGQRYQTKDTPLQLCEEYEIRDDGTMWVLNHDTEWIPNEDELFGGMIKHSNHQWTFCSEFDGLIRFYYYNTGEQEIEYEALFMDGNMLKLTQTKGDSFTMWYKDGIKTKGLE